MIRTFLILYFLTVVIPDSFSQKNILGNNFAKISFSLPLVVDSRFYEKAKFLSVNEKTNALLFQTKKYYIVGEIKFNKHCNGLLAIDASDSTKHTVNLILCSPSGTLIDNIFIYQSESSISTSSVISKDKILVTSEKFLLDNNNKIGNEYKQCEFIPPAF